MSTATNAPARVGGDSAMTIEVGPGGLAKFLDSVTRLPGRITYRDGRVTIVSPSYSHERGVWLLKTVVEVIATEFAIPFRTAGSTLFLRDDLDRGVEPDGSFYFEHRDALRGARGAIDLRRYPPPELVIEVVWTHSAAGALEVCRAMGVPEVWLHDLSKSTLEFLRLDPAGSYVAGPRSLVFPFLGPADVLARLLEVSIVDDDGLIRRRLVAWARDELAPRGAGG